MRGAARAEDAQVTPTKSRISPRILVTIVDWSIPVDGWYLPIPEKNGKRGTCVRSQVFGFMVEGCGFRVWGSGSRVEGAEIRI